MTRVIFLVWNNKLSGYAASIHSPDAYCFYNKRVQTNMEGEITVWESSDLPSPAANLLVQALNHVIGMDAQPMLVWEFHISQGFTFWATSLSFIAQRASATCRSSHGQRVYTLEHGSLLAFSPPASYCCRRNRKHILVEMDCTALILYPWKHLDGSVQHARTLISDNQAHAKPR